MTYENFVLLVWVYAGVFTWVVVWVVVLEITGLFLLKKNLRDLEHIMQQWVDNHNLTPQEKRYWWQATKVMSSPLSVVRMMGKVWLLPLHSTQKSPLAIALQNKNPALYEQTHKKLTHCFFYASPTLLLILLLDFFLVVMFYAVMILFALSIQILSVFMIMRPYTWVQKICKTFLHNITAGGSVFIN